MCVCVCVCVCLCAWRHIPSLPFPCFRHQVYISVGFVATSTVFYGTFWKTWQANNTVDVHGGMPLMDGQDDPSGEASTNTRRSRRCVCLSVRVCVKHSNTSPVPFALPLFCPVLLVCVCVFGSKKSSKKTQTLFTLYAGAYLVAFFWRH